MRLSKILKSALNLYRYPSVFLHELSHIIMIYLLGNKIHYFHIEVCENLELYVYINVDKYESKGKTFFYSMSPFFIFGLVGVLAFFSPFFLILFAYMLTNLKRGLTLPSDGDYNFFKNCEKYRDEYERMLLEDPTIVIGK